VHPRTIGWFGTSSVAMGGSNQSLFLLGSLLVGQGAIPGQGSAAVLLLIVGLFLGWAAAPGWTELVLMFPNRVGGISATCSEAFRPYSPVLACLTGVCYWWGWAPACGLTALLAATEINRSLLPWFPVSLLASGLIIVFTIVSLCGVKWVMRLAMPLALLSALLGFMSAVVPIISGQVDWHQAFDFDLTVPFPGWFGGFTSLMAGLYLVGFAAPAFEQASSHVGETINPNRNVPRAIFASAAIALLFFMILPIVWLGTLGPHALADDLATVLGPTFAPLLGGLVKAAAFWFIALNMFHIIIAALAGPPRALAQLAEDGLLPEFMARRSSTDAPWVTTLITAAVAIICLLAQAPLWLIAAANFTYLISISLTSIAVWLLRKDQPGLLRPYRAPQGTIHLGLVAAGGWLIATVFGFEQFGLPTVLTGIVFAYSGAALYAWRKMADHRKLGLRLVPRTLHVKLTGAMLLVLLLDSVGYFIAVNNVLPGNAELITVLADIFVVVAILTIGVGLVLPGMIAHSASQVSDAAQRLLKGTMTEFTMAMNALATGDLNAAKVNFSLIPVVIHSRDEIGDMALNFNRLQEEIGRASEGLAGAREGLLQARKVAETNVRLQLELSERSRTEEKAREQAALLDKATDAILVCNLGGGIIYLNPSAAKLYGWELADLGEENGIERIYKNPREFGQTKALILEKGDWNGEIIQMNRNGEELFVESRWTLLRDGHGQAHSILLINNDIARRRAAEIELEKANKHLHDISRQAGMAEIATSVLHNVGNVLNSLNVSTTLVSERIRNSKLGKLGKVSALIQEHSEDLGAFFTHHPKGKLLSAYFQTLAEHAEEEQKLLINEMRSVLNNVDHIKDIVTKQQAYAKIFGVTESLQVADLIDDAVQLNQGTSSNHTIQFIRQYEDAPIVSVERHKVLQILVNLFRNAEHACNETDNIDKKIVAHLSVSENFVHISITDNGIGIRPENQTLIFSHGFTTRQTGHGFGLHNSSLVAKELGGSLSCASAGLHQGACFTLNLPYQPTVKLE